MVTAVLERVVAAARGDNAARAADFLRELITILPWAGGLPADDFVTMCVELREAIDASEHSDDDASLARLLDEWEATAESYSNRGFMEQLAPTDKVYEVWPIKDANRRTRR